MVSTDYRGPAGEVDLTWRGIEVRGKMRSMGFFHWIGSNWFPLLATGGVLGSFLFTGLALLLDARSRRAGNLILLTDRHRNLWERMCDQPELARIMDPEANIKKVPIAPEEEMFVIFIILHLSDNYYVIKAGFFEKPRGLRKDVQNFFDLPIPRAVWQKVRGLQDEAFVRFVESCWSDSV